MKNKIIKRMRAILCMLLAVLMLFGTGTTTVYAVETLTGDKNTSDSIYHWTRIRSVEQLMTLAKSTFGGDGKQAKEMRLLLIPAVSHGDDELPGFEEYYILNKSSNWCEDIDLDDNPALKYDSEEFFTRGAFRLPYLSYEGMNNSKEAIEAFGEAVPSFRIFEAGKDDKKTNELLRSAYNQALQRQVIRQAGSKLGVNDSDIWEIGFPTTKSTTKLYTNVGNCVYREATKELVTVGAYNKDDARYYWLADDVIASVLDYQLVPNKYNGRYFNTVSEIFFKCYVGIKDEQVETIGGTITVNKGAVKVLDGMSYIKDEGVLKVPEGATLFISGTCINNGTIENSGGTIILQKGALLMPLDPKKKDSTSVGMVKITAGEMIIREGARVINFNNNANCYMRIEPKGSVINRGIIAVRKAIYVLGSDADGRGRLENYGYIYAGYDFKNNISTSGYDSSVGVSAKEYATNITKSFREQLRDAELSLGICTAYYSGSQSYNKGIFINNGIYNRVNYVVEE